MLTFRQHIPGFVSGIEPETLELDKFSDLLKMEKFMEIAKRPGFYGFFVSVDTKPEYKVRLMALYNWNEEYNGCEVWWVLGTITGCAWGEMKDSNGDTLGDYRYYIKSHKPNCWTRIYEAHKDLLQEGSLERRVKAANELGLNVTTVFGINRNCTCGFDKKSDE